MVEPKRVTTLKSLLRTGKRILLLDGAMGTSIQESGLGPDDFGGVNFEGCNEYLCVTRPDVVSDIHKSFLDAGADIIETNSFGSTSVVLAEYGLADQARYLNREAALIARRVADEASDSERTRFVAGSMGPTTKTISVTGGITFDDLAVSYYEQALGLIEGGVDVLLLETGQDVINVKAGLDGIDRAIAELDVEVAVAVQGTIEIMGTLLAGQDAEAFYTSMAHRNLLWLGFNCATGPEFMTDHIRTLASIAHFPVSCVPNAGLPDEDGNYNESPEMIASTIGRFVESGWVNVVGGCCGTRPDHIRSLSSVVNDKLPRSLPNQSETRVSGIEALVIDEDLRPCIVGERTNVLGSRRFRKLINEGAFEEASEIGRTQIRNGAHVLDVCLQDPDREEIADMAEFLGFLTRKIKSPIMVDSTDHHVIEEALKMLQGKSIINSINLEDGEARFEEVVPLAKRYGAALVVGCIDDDPLQAQAITRERKLEIAIRSHQLLTEKYGIREEDIIFDALVFPAGTGDQNYVGSAAETIEGIRLIKNALPKSKTILGISNVSFGLPPAGREVFNSVFLYHCVMAGLDLAIVNSEMLQRYTSIPQEERALSEDLIWPHGDDPIASFANHFRDRAPKATTEARLSLPLDERLALSIIEGSKEGLAKDLDEALEGRLALEIINGPLMDGMDEVGRQFNANQLIVAEVLQSAESMKFAVTHLEPYMERSSSAIRGKIILATVKGDVHDIGKNLVDIILSNNGYEVVNLGIKVPPQQIIQAYEKHHPDLIGLSGLLVKSAQMMVETTKDFRQAGIKCPIMVGGAALSNRFTRLRIAPEYDGLVTYAKDAMTGLALAKTLLNTDAREGLIVSIEKETREMMLAEKARRSDHNKSTIPQVSAVSIGHEFPVPRPPDLLSHSLIDYDLEKIFSYINPQMLYVRHLGFKGRFRDALASGDKTAVTLKESVRKVEEILFSNPDIQASAVYKFFPCNSTGEELFIYGPDQKTVLEKFRFGRQSERDGLCLADYARPKSSGDVDYIAAFVTTIGPGVRALSDEWNIKGDYLNSHILQSLAIEGAEAFAELLHQEIRRMWGFRDDEETSFEDLFRTKYRGRRYSFGYPACPRLEDQQPLFRMLMVTPNIGVELTDGFMMDPEGSVSALVFHHSDAKYFNLSEIDQERLEREISRGG
jgi:5-methyltetrahydrofolate--homocysteine methyltransferase